MEGIAMAGIDHAFNCVELPSGRLAFPCDEKKPGLFGRVLLSESPDARYVELSFRVKLDAAEAKTAASWAVM
jgi:hypothetical protein